jgi:hypothetical protein
MVEVEQGYTIYDFLVIAGGGSQVVAKLEEEVVLEDLELPLKQLAAGTTITVTVGDGGAGGAGTGCIRKFRF